MEASHVDPGLCSHPKVERLGRQLLPCPPFRVFLVNCLACGDTLTTDTVRKAHEDVRARP
jgi:hypothetical protein